MRQRVARTPYKRELSTGLFDQERSNRESAIKIFHRPSVASAYVLRTDATAMGSMVSIRNFGVNNPRARAHTKKRGDEMKNKDENKKKHRRIQQLYGTEFAPRDTAAPSRLSIRKGADRLQDLFYVVGEKLSPQTTRESCSVLPLSRPKTITNWYS